MRAYLAILKDSFRESMRSRVLWLLLLAITALLLLLLPFSIREKSGYRIAEQDLTNRRELARLLIQQAASGEKPHVKRMWDTLDEDTRKRWQERYDPADGKRRRGPANDVVEGLNALLESPELYDDVAWQEQTLSEEVVELIQRKEAGEEIDTLALNRRLLEAAFPGYITESAGTSFFASYFNWETPFPIATSRAQLRLVTNFSISALMGLIVGVAGVFIAILVTASMIPTTFASGSIDLLLSKPIGRSMLYLTKFLGGCTFILINAAYLLTGFWLIAGLRLGVWTNRILWCIPVFLFLFAIYYSVSALAGVIWRNTIICVVVSFLFWLMCFIIGKGHESIEIFYLEPSRLTQVTQTGDTLVGTNSSGLVAWDDATNSWSQVEPKVSNESRRREGSSPRDPFGSSTRISSLSYDAAGDRILGLVNGALAVGKADDGYSMAPGAAIPLGAKQLYRNEDGSVSVVCTHGIFRIDGDLSKVSEDSEPLKLGGFSLPIRRTQQFESIGPTNWQGMGIKFSVGRSPVSQRMALYDRGQVSSIVLNEEGAYERQFELQLEGDKEAHVGTTEKTILVARHDGVMRLVDIASQSQVAEFQPYPDETVDQVLPSPDGHWFVVKYNNHSAVVIDAENQVLSTKNIPSDGNIATLAFSAADRLLIADKRQRVTAWSIAEGNTERLATPTTTRFESVFFWVIDPIYRVFPKPADLGKLVQYILLKDTLGSGVLSGPLEELEMTRSDIWNPIYSNLAFVFVVLLLGCVYVSRKEF